MQCEHLHQSTKSQEPTELAWENASGSSLMGARHTHHMALLEEDVSFRFMDKRMDTPEQSPSHCPQDSRTPASTCIVPGPWHGCLDTRPRRGPCRGSHGGSSLSTLPLLGALAVSASAFTKKDRMLTSVAIWESAQKRSPWERAWWWLH